MTDLDGAVTASAEVAAGAAGCALPPLLSLFTVSSRESHPLSWCSGSPEEEVLTKQGLLALAARQEVCAKWRAASRRAEMFRRAMSLTDH